MSNPPRVAFFTDCFHEVNGVALTSRRFEAYARDSGLPFFSVHSGPETLMRICGSVTTLELARSRMVFGVDADLQFDMLFLRRLRAVRAALRPFRPDLVHITSPGDIGILGAIVAHQLGVPLSASWHTNLHEFAGRRTERALGFVPGRLRRSISDFAERKALDCTVRFYRLPRLVFAPNQDLVRMLRAGTGRPVHLMRRGVDTVLFNAARRDRSDGDLVLGYVGRITAEKNVRLLVPVERALVAAGIDRFRIVVVGQGSELPWLESNLEHGEFPGVLRGEALARVYANMDLFLFPSRTDTFGNVIQEALASGVPSVVTASGGPKYLIENGETGIVAGDDAAFCQAAVDLARAPGRLESLKRNVRESVGRDSWDSVFDRVYQAYAEFLDAIPGAAGDGGVIPAGNAGEPTVA